MTLRTAALDGIAIAIIFAPRLVARRSARYDCLVNKNTGTPERGDHQWQRDTSSLPRRFTIRLE